MYTSNLFAAARDYAESTGDSWCIISAKHKVVHPADVIEPYEAKLPTRDDDAYWWGELVVWQLTVAFGRQIHLEMLMGADYCKPIREWAGLKLIEVSEPLSGLQIGERMARLKEMSQPKEVTR